MMGLESASPPPILFQPQTLGEVEHDPFDEHTEVQRVPPGVMRDEVITISLLRAELQDFAKDTLHGEFSKMRSLLQEDIQDALLHADARALCNIGGKRAPGSKNIPPKQWAAPRPPPASTEKVTACNIDSSCTIYDSEMHTSRSMPKGYTSRDSDDLHHRSTDLHNGSTNSQTAGEVSILPQGLARIRTASITEAMADQLQKDMKRVKKMYQKRRGKSFQSINFAPEALGETTKRRIDRCWEIFFEHGIAVIILLNGIFIGVQADYQARNLTEAVPPIFPLVEIVFCVVFFMELLVRIRVFGKAFFVGNGWRWNWFDAILVIIQLIEVAGMLFTKHESSSATPVANLSFLRLMRILRLFRILRLVRLVKFIGEVNTITSSIANSMSSLCWTLFLLSLMIYIVGIFFTQAVFSQRILMNASDPSIAELDKWWGTLDRSILSLYSAILGGDIWEGVSNHVNPILTIVFCFYIAFALLAMMNVITGIFVESALKNAEKEKDSDFTETAKAIFMLSDTDRSDQITREEFETQIEEPLFQFYMKSFGIDPADAKLLFKFLDHDQSGALNLEELLGGMIRLRAGVTFIDVMKILHQIERNEHLLRLRFASQEKM